MDLAFAKKWIRAVCEKRKKAEKRFGADIARSLRNRLADLRAAANAEDLPLGNPEKVKKGRQIRIALCKGATLTFKSNHNATPKLPDGTPDWSNVYRIQIVGIECEND